MSFRKFLAGLALGLAFAAATASARADTSLYLAKENGRNRVEVEKYTSNLPSS